VVLQTQTGSLQTYGAVEAAGPGVVIPDARLLFTADFSRAGHDLVLTGSEGANLITDFGSADTLDLTGLLDDVFDPESDNIEDFVRATTNTLTGETTVAVDIDGPGGPAQFADIAVLQGIGADFGIKGKHW
jgi:hypothetical protein